MTITTLNSLLQNITNSDTASYSDASKYVDLTVAALFLNGEMMNSMMDWDFQGDTATANIVASITIANRYYAFPSNFLKLKRVELMADGSNWYPCAKIDIGEIATPLGNESDVTNNFSNTTPYYSIIGNKILILSGTLTAVANGIRYYFAESIVGTKADGTDLTAFAAGDDIPNISEPFQMGLVYYAAKLWFQKYQNMEMARIMDAELEKTIARMNQSKITNEKLFLKTVSDLSSYE